MFAKKRWMLQKEFSFIISCEKCGRCFMGSLPFYCFREYPIKKLYNIKGMQWLTIWIFIAMHYQTFCRCFFNLPLFFPFAFNHNNHCSCSIPFWQKMQKCKNAKMQKCKNAKNAKMQNIKGKRKNLYISRNILDIFKQSQSHYS